MRERTNISGQFFGGSYFAQIRSRALKSGHSLVNLHTASITPRGETNTPRSYRVPKNSPAEMFHMAAVKLFGAALHHSASFWCLSENAKPKDIATQTTARVSFENSRAQDIASRFRPAPASADLARAPIWHDRGARQRTRVEGEPGSSIRRPQAIADPRLRQDILRTFRIGLDLLPQLPDVHPQILSVGQIVPQLAEQKLVGEHLAGVLHQNAQKLVLLGRQFHVLVTHLDDTSHQIDGQIAHSEDWALAVSLQLVAQRRAHPGEKLIHAKRLGDVIIGAEVERLNLAGLVTAAGQHHDRHALVARSNHSQQFEPLHVRQPEIEDHQIRLLLLQQLKRDAPIWRFKDIIAVRAQAHPKQLANGRLIVNDKDLGRGSVHPAVSNRPGFVGIGSVMVNTAPLRSVRFAAVTVPCMASMKPREMARPSPVPARTWSAFCTR